VINIAYTPQSLFDIPETSMVTNDFTYSFHAFVAAPGLEGTVVRTGAPCATVEDVVAGVLLCELHDTSNSAAAATSDETREDFMLPKK
jgi:hypothetical protein